jgi:hypothetical protein
MENPDFQQSIKNITGYNIMLFHKKAAIALLIPLLLLFLPVPGDALRIGMAPPVYDIGEVEPGKEYYIDFYLTSDQDKDTLVDLAALKAPYDFYLPERIRFRYRFNTSLASEEDASGWITILENNPISVPTEKNLYRLANGGLTNANKKLTAVVKIPEHAEPGYHAAYVVPSSREKIQGGGTAIGIITVAKMGYVFNVKGDVRREGKIIGFGYEKTRDSGTLNVVFKNTGTVTMTIQAKKVRIYDKDQQQIVQLDSRQYKCRPGNVMEIPLQWYNSSLEEGMYSVEGAVEWIGGETSGSGRIQLTHEPVTEKITGEAIAPPPAAVFPLWIIPIILLIAGFLVYRWK